MKAHFLEYWSGEIIGLEIIAETKKEIDEFKKLIDRGQELSWYSPYNKFEKIIRIRLKGK